MEVINSVSTLKAKVSAFRKDNKQIGLVPTMGALHNGHASLVSRSVKENDVTIVSVFVNPTQFNDKNDLEKYPRTLEADCALLEGIGATLVFAPTVEEIYPEPDTRSFSYAPTDSVMEGAFRPGHFNGVCQIVSKLFMFVEPDKAYFGEKDFQQIAVIKAMVADYRSQNAEWAKRLTICPCPIVRENDGLALSSRNTLLTAAERAIAPNIYKALAESVTFSKSHSVEETKAMAVNAINSVNGLEVQYYEIVNADTLQSVTSWDDAEHIQGCITVFCGATPIRLIDNINYK
ncbi:MAG: pantoate--beta-alanine ligase [Bacteroidaceae bacterium]|nr:pantoate--beta-alanine ligase [Bacteroidaceae bacterium]MBQ7156736.1 pantoate--beta-alanine ligase [Bacteroidaceae bacterium]